MNRSNSFGAIVILTVILLLILASCSVLANTPVVSSDRSLLPMATQTFSFDPLCETCSQATLSALQTQEKSSADAQAAATAEIMRANAQATLNSASSTLSAALTQEQNNTNIIAAQVAATAAIVRADAQATLIAAGSTQSAAMTLDAIHQTETAAISTQNAVATVTQQNYDFIASKTGTAAADYIATQTQSAVATSQWYTDQERQRADNRQNQMAILWMWCPLFLILIITFIGLLFFWRQMRIREDQKLLDAQPERVIVIEHKPDVTSDSQYPLAGPQDHVRRWLDEVRRNLLTRKDDDDDNPES
jgi:hypothetical protein